jgi:hypothetical protein
MGTRTSMNFWLDFLSFLVMIGLAATGGIVHYVFPAGTGHFYLLFGLGRHDFGQIHFYLAVAAIVLLVLHVLLHWSWICGVIGKSVGSPAPSQKARMTWGLSLLCGVVLFLGGGVWWASSKVEQNATPRNGQSNRGHTGSQRGQSVSRSETSNGESSAIPDKSSGQEKAHEPSSTPPATRQSEKHLEECPAGATINGRTSFSEAAKTCGMSVEQLREYLKLPTGVNYQERLGHLKRRYGFTIQDVRKLACR